MSKKISVGCARPTGGPVGGGDEGASRTGNAAETWLDSEKEVAAMVMVGKKAPDFTAPAYHNGEFVGEKLSNYLGKWVLLCFYPGDFTFV